MITTWIRTVRSNIADVLSGALALTLGAVILTGYDLAGDGILRVLLWPHARITGAFYHIILLYQNGVGYVALGRNFVISPACMGMRFIVMLFCMTTCFFVRRFRGSHKTVFFVLSLIGSLAVGILASCVRIVGSVSILSSGQYTAIHAGTGIVVYLITLVGIYILINRATGGSYEKQ
jgi:exosortase K